MKKREEKAAQKTLSAFTKVNKVCSKVRDLGSKELEDEGSGFLPKPNPNLKAPGSKLSNYFALNKTQSSTI